MCLCLLSVLNFWQTTRNTEQSCPAAEAFSPLATLITVWPSSPILLAPNHAGPAQTSVWKQSCRDTDTLDGGSLSLAPLHQAVQPGAYWALWSHWALHCPAVAGLLVTWVVEEEQDASFISGSDLLSWKHKTETWPEAEMPVTTHWNLPPCFS